MSSVEIVALEKEGKGRRSDVVGLTPHKRSYPRLLCKSSNGIDLCRSQRSKKHGMDFGAAVDPKEKFVGTRRSICSTVLRKHFKHIMPSYFINA